MDSLQAILDMQLLAIEKTLLVANGHHQAEMGKEVEQLITHFGKSMTDLMQRMSKAKPSRPRNKDPWNRIEKRYTKPRSFSTGLSSSEMKKKLSISINSPADEYAVVKFARSLQPVAKLCKRHAFTKWKIFTWQMEELEHSREYSRSRHYDEDESEDHHVEDYLDQEEGTIDDDGPPTFSPSIYNAIDGQPIDMDAAFDHGFEDLPPHHQHHHHINTHIYPPNHVISASTFLHEDVKPEGERFATPTKRTQANEQSVETRKDILQSTNFLKMIPEASPSWERHLQWNAGLSEGVEISP